jgi:hypothetical protein
LTVLITSLSVLARRTHVADLSEPHEAADVLGLLSLDEARRRAVGHGLAVFAADRIDRDAALALPPLGEKAHDTCGKPASRGRDDDLVLHSILHSSCTAPMSSPPKARTATIPAPKARMT